jgi:hypothetical protein
MEVDRLCFWLEIPFQIQTIFYAQRLALAHFLTLQLPLWDHDHLTHPLATPYRSCSQHSNYADFDT